METAQKGPARYEDDMQTEGAMYDDARQDFALLGDTDRRPRADLVFKSEPKDRPIEARLAVAFEELYGICAR
jgi:hypothetical protein